MAAFRSGRLPAAAMEGVADHLGVCTACAAAFDDLRDDDPIVSKLRRYLAQSTPPLDPQCDSLAAGARLICLDSTGAGTSAQETQRLGERGEPGERGERGGPGELVALPRRFGGYELVRRLGDGGMGVVWEARHLRLNRRVALKLIRFLTADGAERDRFRREGEAVARMRHPNIVEVFGAGEADGQPYIEMELLEGGTLARRLKERSYRPREAAGLVQTLALAVQAAHDAGIVHRDLKPSNVLFAADGTPRVTDFGLAKFLDADMSHTKTGDVLGTPSYMAPEQARGDAAAIGPRTDVYALGAILYELLNGRPPFRGDNPAATLAQVLCRRPAPPIARHDEARKRLAAIWETCLEKDPRYRYPSAAALAEDLDRWLDGLPTKAKPPGPLVRVGRFVRRRKFLCGSLAACGLATVGGLAGWRLLWDPDAAAAEIERRLAAGQAVELLGSGRDSKPVWSRVVAGTPVMDTSVIGGAFRLHCFSPPGMLELVRDAQVDRYAIRAQVRHEADQESGEVGLYLARREQPTPSGLIQAFVLLCFNDIHSSKKSAEDWNRDHPKQLQHVPVANPLFLKAALDWKDGEIVERVGIPMAKPPEIIEPAGWNSAQWRSVVVNVSPEVIRVQWEDAEAPAFDIPAGRMEEVLSDYLEHEPRAQVKAYLRQAPIVFAPRGGVGLYAWQGAASFQNVRVEPLG
jgi:serine/threonine-protein kinase